MIGAFVKAPPLAWSGWRLRVPGEPEGGQYHGFIAADSHGWRGLPGAPPPAAPPAPWDSVWGGSALLEGETHSDYVYRSPAELRPRPNASGGTNVIRALQTRKSAGYAEAPGNYKGLGMGPIYCPEIACENVVSYGPAPCHTPVCGPTSVVRQPPPPQYPAPSPAVCAPGQYRDSAGYCTADWHNPYSLYLPSSPAPAPTVAAPPNAYLPSQGQPLPCPAGYTNDPSSGACVPASGISAWLSESTLIPGVENMWVAGGAALAAFLFLRGRK